MDHTEQTDVMSGACAQNSSARHRRLLSFTLTSVPLTCVLLTPFTLASFTLTSFVLTSVVITLTSLTLMSVVFTLTYFTLASFTLTSFVLTSVVITLTSLTLTSVVATLTNVTLTSVVATLAFVALSVSPTKRRCHGAVAGDAGDAGDALRQWRVLVATRAGPSGPNLRATDRFHILSRNQRKKMWEHASPFATSQKEGVELCDPTFVVDREEHCTSDSSEKLAKYCFRNM